MTETKKFAIGDRVGAAYGYYDGGFDKKPVFNGEESNLVFGTVTDITSRGKIMVKWDSAWVAKKEDNLLLDHERLMTEEEAKTKSNTLEQEFRAVEKQVKAKMAEAGAAITEAKHLASEAGLSLSEMYDATGPLYSAMDDCGWHTSSLGC
jgi:hypothetical protein